MRRSVLRLLVLVPLAGCVVPTDPLRMAAYGPSTHIDLAPAGHAMQAGDRIALVVRAPSLDGARLSACIAEGLRARLPAPGPVIVAADAAAAAALDDTKPAGQTPVPEASAFGAEWIVLVRDTTTRSEEHETRFGADGGGGGGAIGVISQERIYYTLRLEATILDLRARRELGRALAFYSARGGSGVAAGVAFVGLPIPFVVPIFHVPAGTSAMAICNAFGRAIGDALVQAGPIAGG